MSETELTLTTSEGLARSRAHRARFAPAPRERGWAYAARYFVGICGRGYSTKYAKTLADAHCPGELSNYAASEWRRGFCEAILLGINR